MLRYYIIIEHAVVHNILLGSGGEFVTHEPESGGACVSDGGHVASYVDNKVNYVQSYQTRFLYYPKAH